MEELRRSGRFKSKGHVVEENTVSDAYSVDDESSGDDFVDLKGKAVEVVKRVVKRVSRSNVSQSNDDTECESVSVKKRKKSNMTGDHKDIIHKVKQTKGETSKSSTSKPKKRKGKKLYVFQTRTSPKTLYNAIVTLKPIQKACLARIGFADLLDFKLDGVPSKLGFYVVDNFNEHEMQIKLEHGSIVITKQLIGEMLGIINDGVDVMAEENANDDEMINDWNAQFNEEKEITPSSLKSLIRKSKVADMNFKLNFIVLFTSVMGGVKPRGLCDLSVLYKISRKTDLSKINWCEYVWSCLKKCKVVWKRNMTNSFFLGPIACLAMLYVDGTVCNEFNVGRKRPPTSFWTMELLKERECEELNSGGLGKGELQGPFVEEDDPMPKDEDEFLWKLNKYIETIRQERYGFERTFGAASDMFPDNTLIADVYQQYRLALHYKNGGNDGKSYSHPNVDNSDKPQENILHVEVDKNSVDYDSPTYEFGPSTQKELFTMVDKVVEEYNSSKRGNDLPPPSFSFGVNQVVEPVLSLETPVTDRNTHVFGSAHQSEPIKAVPVSMCKPVLQDEDEVYGRGRRKYTKSQASRSPFMSRVTDINATESKDDKRVEKFLLNKMGIEQSVVLFESKFGTKASRKQMESLVNGENIDDGVVNAWSEHLNSLESLRAENSMSRFFLPTFIVDKKAFAIEANAIASMHNFLIAVETENERAGRKNMINLVDLVFIPVSNHGHKFLICVNLKFPAVNMIDSMDNMANPFIVTNTNDMVVASILHKGFCNYLDRLNPNKAATLLMVQVTRENFEWQTAKRPNDSGVFLMRHMESYMGSIVSRWSCGLETEGRKQNKLLGRLRKKYAATLLLSECNMRKEYVRAQMDCIEVSDVPVKRMKLPKRG